MKILLLTQWYPPEPQEFLAEMAQSLRDLGHEVTVLTGFPNWPSGKVYPGYKIRPWQHETMDGIPVIRVPLYPDHSRSGWKRVLNYSSFALSASLLGPWLAPRADVIHVIPPLTSCVPGWLLSQLWGVPFTHEVQDIWPETLAATGMVRNALVLGAVGRFARWVYYQAAAIRVISPGFQANLVAKGVASKKIHVLSNWVDAQVFHPEAPSPTMAEELGLAGRFNVMYAGTMGPCQGLTTVIEAATLLSDLPDVQFVMVGDGIGAAALQETACARGLSNVRFLGRHPLEAMSSLYALADILLVHLVDNPLFRITIPHKIFSYFASGKPVLAAVEGDAAAVIDATGAGLCCPSGNPEALANAVRRFRTMSHAERDEMGARGLQASRTLFSREVMMKRFSEMLEAICDRTGPQGRLPAEPVGISRGETSVH